MRVHATTVGTRCEEVTEIVIVAALALATALVAVLSIQGAVCRASATLLPARGKVHIRAFRAVPGQRGANFHAFPSAVGKVIPASWPHTAGLVRAGKPVRPALSGTSASANWAGYEDTGAGAQFSEVSADWTVPAVQVGTYGDSSTWVGIDGTSTSDLIQAGTDQSWSPNGAVYYAWYELLPGPFRRTGPGLPRR